MSTESSSTGTSGLARLAGDRRALVLSAALIVQIALVYGFSRAESPAPHQLLEAFPTSFGGWEMVQQGVVEKEVQDVLRADDVMTRTYAEPATGSTASLFVAYFRSQRTGVTPHSPKNCLPGAGWAPTESSIISLSVPGYSEPVPANLYSISRGDAKSVVLYWYESRSRVVASEYAAKIYLVLDSIRFNRSDTALVRIVVPAQGQGREARQTAERFARDCFVPLRPFVPGA